MFNPEKHTIQNTLSFGADGHAAAARKLGEDSFSRRQSEG